MIMEIIEFGNNRVMDVIIGIHSNDEDDGEIRYSNIQFLFKCAINKQTNWICSMKMGRVRLNQLAINKNIPINGMGNWQNDGMFEWDSDLPTY